MSRRGAAGALLALAAGTLSGCSLLRRDRAEAIGAAVSAVEGVTGAELRTGRNAMFHTWVSGDVQIDADSRAAGLDVYVEVMRQVATVLHDRDEPLTLVGGILGRLPDGTELTAMELGLDFPTDEPRLDDVPAELLFEKYGLS